MIEETKVTYDQLRRLLEDCGQAHLLHFWPALHESERRRLASQVLNIDWVRMKEWINEYVIQEPKIDLPVDLQPAPSLPVSPVGREQKELYDNAVRHGRDLLKAGKVAGFTVAGGQGTRLGFDGPKGTLPISPIKNKSLFQLFAEGVLRAGEKYGVEIPWYIMTSPLNDRQTIDFFRKHDYFGVSPANVMFFPQGVMPVIGLDGRVLLSAPDSLALSPNGHGGSLPAMRASGALEDMSQRGIEYISYWQVDNPLVYMFDPLFIGLHARTGAEMSCRGLLKSGPYEKLGNFVSVDNRIVIVEYSDMPEELATMRDENGKLLFRIGSPAIHILNRSFVERLTEDGNPGLPFHRAEKKVGYINEAGDRIEPDQPNAVKLETFIFDALPKADNVLILEAEREEQFGPVKSRVGVDSVESCRRLLINRAGRWLGEAGIEVPRTKEGETACRIELSPRSFMEPEDVKAKADIIRPHAKRCRTHASVYFG